MRLPYVISEILTGVVEAEAAKIEVPMAIAIVDGEGGLQLFKRMDGTLPVSTELAISKAYTAAVLRMPTHQVGELAQPGAALYGIQQVKMDPSMQKMTVEYDATRLRPAEVEAALAQAGIAAERT